jgi:hypothetical protein
MACTNITVNSIKILFAYPSAVSVKNHAAIWQRISGIAFGYEKCAKKMIDPNCRAIIHEKTIASSPFFRMLNSFHDTPGNGVINSIPDPH